MNTSADIPRFAADRMLERLARWLRLCGVDLLTAARWEGRIVLTRDKRLRTAPDVLYFSSQRVREQLREVLQRFAIDPHRDAFTRCTRCNSLLHQVSRESVAQRVPPFVYASQSQFCECDSCGRIYWRATHPERIMAEVARAQSASNSTRSSVSRAPCQREPRAYPENDRIFS